MIKDKLNIAVLCGGKSSEREISLLSGANVSKALKNKGHDVTFVDTQKTDDLKSLLNNHFDIAFNALHGKGGEDGAIQGFLETIGLKYTGSKIEASVKSINKGDTKIIFETHQIPSAPFFIIKANQDYDLNTELAKTGDDVVVKAASEGSSIGLYFAKGMPEIKNAIDKALNYDNNVVVEKRIVGREFTCAVIELPANLRDKSVNKIYTKDNLSALPVIEIIPKNDFYDFNSKYDKGGSEHVCPAKIDDKIKEAIQIVALKAHKTLGCSGFSRTDILVDNNDNVFALETNTIPGMTDSSLVPDAARAIGIEFDDLCELLVLNELSN